MPKKRVGVSLRKPSPSPAPETVPEAAAVATEVAREAVAADAAVDSDPSTMLMSTDAAASERPSDIVALRESPAPAETKAIDAFVNGAAAAFEKVATTIPPARLAEVLKRGIEGYRELVLYLPEKLAQQLSLHCLEHNLDMSRLVATAIEQHLSGTGIAAPAAARRSDDALPNEGLLTLAARALMGELAAWLRSVWARRRVAAGSVPSAAVS
jgi:hypothetical protein